MHRPHGRWPHWLLLIAVAATGCQPRHPLYLQYNEDLATYIDEATALAYPDVDRPSLDEVTHAHAPLTLDHPEFHTFWDLTLQEAVQIALQNSKVIRNTGSVTTPGVPDTLIARPETVATIYDPAIIETDPEFGVQAALAAFDAQFSSSLFWNTVDRPQNRPLVQIPGTGVLFPPVIQQRLATFNAELSKRAATGTQFFFRNITEYDRSEPVTAFQALPSFYTTQFEAEVRHPLLRGGGTAVNRVPILLARTRTDVALAEFEANVRNLVLDIENAYWELYCAYRNLQTAKVARDSTLYAWQITYERAVRVSVDLQTLETQARQQYFSFRVQTESALNELYNAETNLRWLMGLTATDGRLIRPVDEPTTAKVTFEWPVVSAEALVRSPELRRLKWFIKQREIEMIAARNELLPDFNVTGLYRWFGAGDELINADRNGLNFPARGSTAFDVLTEGDYQEARFGFDFAFPLGFRRAYAFVRNTQLELAREHARLEDAELNVTNALAQAIRNMHAEYQFAQTNFNALVASIDEVNLYNVRIAEGAQFFDIEALRAIQRRAESERAYYRALCDYNQAIANVHFRKGSLLEYDNVFLAEGPWPAKAYFDAEGHARRRAASFYLDYGWTAPPPVSIGEAPQGTFGAEPHAAPFHPAPESAPAEPIPTPPPVRGEPDALELPLPAPPTPPMGSLSRWAPPGRAGVLRTTGGASIASRPPHATMAPAPSAYPAFHQQAPAALAHFVSPPNGGAIAPATYLAPIEPQRDEPLHRLPPTASLAP